ncbi:hypothetical protein [Microbacterium sp. NPDC055683]
MLNEKELAIQTYSPRIDASVWDSSRGWWERVVRAYGKSRSVAAVRLALTFLAGYVAWLDAAGLDVTEAGLLGDDLISSFEASRRLTVSTAVAARERKVLRALAGITSSVELSRPSTSAPSLAPYSVAECALIHAWADTQRSEYARRNTSAVAILGMGAGLTAGEIARVRVRDVCLLADGLPGVNVSSGRPRTVPIARDWERSARALMDVDGPDAYLVAPHASARANLIRTVVASTIGDIRPVAGRLRATWIVSHLDASTPVPILLTAAGLTSADSLRRFLPYTRMWTDPVAISLLRDGGVRC